MTTGSLQREQELTEPGRGGGLAGVLRRRHLLRLIVRRELRARYQASLLGLGWSYVRPAVHFAVYFFVVGVFLQMSEHVEDFPIFMFSGMVLISFFTETLINATHSVVGNAPLVRKVYLPREVFPVASLLVSGVHFVPGLAILLTAAAMSGWTPSVLALVSAVLGFSIVAVLGMALGLLGAALNVFYRDAAKVVDILTVVITWSVPMIYPWTTVRDNSPGWVLQVYLANPVADAVLLFERAFWYPGTDRTSPFPPHLTVDGIATVAGGVVLLGLAQLVFARLQRRFAEEL